VAEDLSLPGREVAILAGVSIHIPRREPESPPAPATDRPGVRRPPDRPGVRRLPGRPRDAPKKSALRRPHFAGRTPGWRRGSRLDSVAHPVARAAAPMPDDDRDPSRSRPPARTKGTARHRPGSCICSSRPSLQLDRRLRAARAHGPGEAFGAALGVPARRRRRAGAFRPAAKDEVPEGSASPGSSTAAGATGIRTPRRSRTSRAGGRAHRDPVSSTEEKRISLLDERLFDYPFNYMNGHARCASRRRKRNGSAPTSSRRLSSRRRHYGMDRASGRRSRRCSPTSSSSRCP